MLGDILSSLFKRPATQQYPFERIAAPERYRGRMVWDPIKCAGCMLCVKDCPSDAIELLVIDRVNKRFVLRYHADKCTYCSQCVVNCRFKCIEMSNDQWENASTQKEPFVVYYGRDEDIQSILGKDIDRGSNVPAG
ncbi:MAG TPA: 4Fe-4S binding protein [Anaerolineaceae bacterium]|nr:4Fe-4S binding protein [Anaerolineaceae bacterium]